jgi:16S rRNA (cytidine1402-2'-O)-methyltransferase
MLYLVATPIGNLGDISVRALETLKQADVIASEDTRKTGRLLKHYGIQKPQLSFHAFNEEQAGAKILARLREGQTVALVTNAGTPGIADPGYSVVRMALQEGLEVSLVPGATAFVMALVLSGLPAHSFVFRGFTPRKATARRKYLAADQDSPYTLIYYESPHRLREALADALAVFGDRPAALANDLTKLFERVTRGPLSELLAGLEGQELQGEYVLVIGGKPEEAPARRRRAPTESDAP